MTSLYAQADELYTELAALRAIDAVLRQRLARRDHAGAPVDKVCGEIDRVADEIARIEQSLWEIETALARSEAAADRAWGEWVTR